MINTEKKELLASRAGACPDLTLQLSQLKSRSIWKLNGLGLGIFKNKLI